METSPSEKPAPQRSPSKKILVQTLWVWFFTMLAIRLFHEAQRISWLAEWIPVLTAAVLIYVPLWISRKNNEPLPLFERNLEGLGKSLFWFSLSALLIFPPLEFANRSFQAMFFHQHYVGISWQLGFSKLLPFAFYQLIVVAIPEEIFYRGFIQTQLHKICGRKWKFLGALSGPALLYTSLIFAASHSLIQLQWWHFAIFFPSLVFGWLRDKTNAVTAGALFHALSNTFSYWVILSYHR